MLLFVLILISLILSFMVLIFTLIQDIESDQVYVLLEERLDVLYKDVKKAKFKILEKIKGKDMEGWEYIPLYSYFESVSYIINSSTVALVALESSMTLT